VLRQPIRGIELPQVVADASREKMVIEFFKKIAAFRRTYALFDAFTLAAVKGTVGAIVGIISQLGWGDTVSDSSREFIMGEVKRHGMPHVATLRGSAKQVGSTDADGCKRWLASSPWSLAVFRLRQASVCNGGECVSR
jgi:hypothetical protein